MIWMPALASVEIRHVLRALGLDTEQADSSIRFSFGRFAYDEESEVAARLVSHALV